MKFDRKMHYVMWLLALCLFSVVLLLKLGIFFPAFDLALSKFMRSLQSSFGILLMRGASELASFWFLALISGFLIVYFLKNKRTRDAIFYICMLVIGVILGVIIKFIVSRPRPSNIFETGFSFPSGHALASVLAFGAIAYFLWEEHRNIAYFMLFVPLIVGISRIYLNVHWFSDVVAGFALGILWLYLCIYIFYRAK